MTVTSDTAAHLAIALINAGLSTSGDGNEVRAEAIDVNGNERSKYEGASPMLDIADATSGKSLTVNQEVQVRDVFLALSEAGLPRQIFATKPRMEFIHVQEISCTGVQKGSKSITCQITFSEPLVRDDEQVLAGTFVKIPERKVTINGKNETTELAIKTGWSTYPVVFEPAYVTQGIAVATSALSSRMRATVEGSFRSEEQSTYFLIRLADKSPIPSESARFAPRKK